MYSKPGCTSCYQNVNDELKHRICKGCKCSGFSEVEANLIHYNELVVTGQTGARRADFGVALDLVVSGKVETEGMITSRFSLENIPKAIEATSSREGIKVAVMPGYEDR